MQVGFNPHRQNNKQNFCALDISKIIKSTHDADMFTMDVAKGKILKTPENVQDLQAAINQAISEGKVFVSKMLSEIAEEWATK